MKITVAQMRSLPSFFRKITDPRRQQGLRHRLPTVLGIAAGAILCGIRSYESIFEWAESLSQKNREHFGCRYEKGRHEVPSLSIIRNVLVRVDPLELNAAFRRWNAVQFSSVQFSSVQHGIYALGIIINNNYNIYMAP